jgi:hypothetical protein
MSKQWVRASEVFFRHWEIHKPRKPILKMEERENRIPLVEDTSTRISIEELIPDEVGCNYFHEWEQLQTPKYSRKDFGL